MSPLDNIVGLVLVVTCGIGCLVCVVVYLIHEWDQRHIARDHRDVTKRQHPAYLAAEARIAREQHAAARQQLIRNTAFLEAHSTHGVGFLEAYANGRVSTWTDGPIPYVPTDREDQS